MSEPIYILSISLVFGTIALIFGMKYYASIRQARTRVLSEDAYRDIAAKSAAALSGTATALAAIQGEVAEIKARMAAVEKILKAVE